MGQELILSSPQTPVEPAAPEASAHPPRGEPTGSWPQRSAINLHGPPRLEPSQRKEVLDACGLCFFCRERKCPGKKRWSQDTRGRKCLTKMGWREKHSVPHWKFMCYPGASTWKTKPESSAARLCPTRGGAAGQLDEGHNTRFLSKILLKPTPCSAGVHFRNNRHKRDDGTFLPDRVAATLAERSTNQLSWRNCKAHHLISPSVVVRPAIDTDRQRQMKANYGYKCS